MFYFSVFTCFFFEVVASVYPTGTWDFYLPFFSDTFIQQVPKQLHDFKQVALKKQKQKKNKNAKWFKSNLHQMGALTVSLVGGQS